VPLIIAAVVVLVDRLTKLYIQRHVGLFTSIPIIPGWLRIIHTENPGAAFGMLAQGNDLLRGAVLIGVSLVVLVFVISALWSHRTSFAAPITRFGLSLIMGGALGNLYDRIFHGTVTDFVDVYRGSWSLPAFNVADSAISVGAILLFIDLLFPRRKTVEQPQPSSR
jgi:signal peptidase II